MVSALMQMSRAQRYAEKPKRRPDLRRIEMLVHQPHARLYLELCRYACSNSLVAVAANQSIRNVQSELRSKFLCSAFLRTNNMDLCCSFVFVLWNLKFYLLVLKKRFEQRDRKAVASLEWFDTCFK